jgi:Cu(I)/Ag(I) efflux system membrane fusion protein
MDKLLALLRQHWGKASSLAVLLICGAALLVSPTLRDQAHRAWHGAAAWVGLADTSAGPGKVFWCPMHPQIKSDRENAICPICTMALIELKGGVVDPPENLILTTQQIQQAGVASEPAMRRTLYREIDTTGRIAHDERRYAGISSWISGKSRIDKLHVNFTGEFVRKGAPLVELYSPTLITAQEEYLIALDARVRRAGRSGADRLGLGQDTLFEAARQKLIYQGMTLAQIEQLRTTRTPLSRIPIYAPVSGTVIHRHVQEGEYVNEGDWLFHLSDLTQLWLMVDVFEDELPLVEIGGNVEFTVESLPGEKFSGRIAFVEPKVDPKTRSIRVRLDVENPQRKLMPGMYARAVLRRNITAALAVPENAVLWSGQRSVVIVRDGEGTFRPREVELGSRWLYARENTKAKRASLGFGDGSIRYHEVLAGLTPGEIVVTSGAFLLNAESQFQSVLTKMLPPVNERATLEQVLGDPLAGQIRQVLGAYFKLSEALADDQIEQAFARLATLSVASQSLAQSAVDQGAGELARDAQKFAQLTAELAAAPIKDAKDARTRFGRISHDWTTLLARHGGKSLFGKDLYQFECGMAKVGYERWLWWSPETHNPYMGQAMPKCGKKLDVLEP